MPPNVNEILLASKIPSTDAIITKLFFTKIFQTVKYSVRNYLLSKDIKSNLIEIHTYYLFEESRFLLYMNPWRKKYLEY